MSEKMSHSEAGYLGALRTKEILLERYEQNPKNCFYCLKKLPYKQRKNKFCCHSCSASYNNKGICRNGDGIHRFCLHCNLRTSNKIYCSSTCNSIYNWNKLKKEMETSGLARAVHTAKKYLKEIRGNKCEICEISEWQNKSLVLILDHINGNSDDWHLINLRLICPNCDSQTSTFKARNKGNGRYNRRKRYQEGKSY